MTEAAPIQEAKRPNAVATYSVLALVVLGTAIEVRLASKAPSETTAAAVASLFTLNSLLWVTLQALVVAMFVAIMQLVTDGDGTPLGSWQAVSEQSAGVMAVGLGCLMFVVMSFGIPMIAVQIWPELIDSHPDVFAGAVPDIPTLLLAFVVTVIGGAVREELWRVAWLRAWERLGEKWLTAGIWISAFAFGSVHAYEGVPAIAITTIMGLLLAYRWSVRRDLSELMIIHGVHNMLTLVLLYIKPFVSAP